MSCCNSAVASGRSRCGKPHLDEACCSRFPRPAHGREDAGADGPVLRILFGLVGEAYGCVGLEAERHCSIARMFCRSSSVLRALVSVSTAVSPVSSPGSTPGRWMNIFRPYTSGIRGRLPMPEISSPAALLLLQSTHHLAPVSFFMATTARQASFMVLK